MIDIIIDRLTNSIRNTISGDQFNTKIIQVAVSEKRIAKTKLVNHYKTSLGATIFHGDQMFIDTPAALKLIRQYFNK